jgi:hypothetical protein
MLYYYEKNGTQIGPIHIDALKKLAEKKRITPETIITNEKGKKWKADDMPELKFDHFEFFIINTLRKMAKRTKRRTEDGTPPIYKKINNDINETPNKQKQILKVSESKPIQKDYLNPQKNLNHKNKQNEFPIRIRHKINIEEIALKITIAITILSLIIMLILFIHDKLTTILTK